MIPLTMPIGFAGAIGPPVLTAGSPQSSSAGSTTITSGATIPAGSLIIVVATSSSAVTLSSVGDGGTNTYTVDDNGTGTPCVAIASCANCSALSGATITATFSGSASFRSLLVYYVTNAATSSPLDKKNSASGTSTTPSATTASTTVNNTVVIGAVATTGSTTATNDASYTTDGNPFGGANAAFTSHKTTNPTTTGAQTYAPTLGSSVGWRCLVAAYKGLS